jgi:hypothetical protein
MASGAHALCVYRGKLYAKTTLEQEFRDALFVVRGDVLSSRKISIASPDVGEGIIYRIKVDRFFKGRSPRVVNFFTPLDSGGFYPEVGVKFLLFLDPISSSEWALDARGATVVNYNCGQSRAWASVPTEKRRRLRTLSAGGR